MQEIRDSGVTVAGALSPQRTKQFAKHVVDAGVDLFVIRGTTVSAEHVSGQAEPLNLKQFIYDLDVPVIVGGCATHQAALHLMRTGAAGVLVGFGGGAAHTTRKVLGVAVPMASAVADVAAARRDYMDESGGRYVHVIADGSVGRSGDVAKAIACGADAVMVGSPLARASDAPGGGYHWGAEAWHPDLPRGERVEVGVDRHARADPVRPVLGPGRHDEPGRRPQARDGHHRLHGAQGVPAGRGRRRVTAPASCCCTDPAVRRTSSAPGSSRPRGTTYSRRGGPSGSEVPLESFPLDELAERNDRLVVMGSSWGAEAALLLGALDERVDAVVAFAPSAYVWGRFVEDGRQRSAWTWQGEPLPFVPFDLDWKADDDPPSYIGWYRQSLEVYDDAYAELGPDPGGAHPRGAAGGGR